jgi:hypothetical protein
MYLLDELDRQTNELSTQAQLLQRVREFVEQNEEKFKDLPNATCYCIGYIDFDRLPHDQVMKVVIAFGGRWNREPVGDRINYVQEVAEGVKVRCYQGQPPPNCRVEYEEVTIPQRTERRAKIVCQPVTHALPDEKPLIEVEAKQIEDEIPF